MIRPIWQRQRHHFGTHLCSQFYLWKCALFLLHGALTLLMIICGRCSNNNNNNNNSTKKYQLCLPMSRYCYCFLLYGTIYHSGHNRKSNYCISQNIHFIDVPDWWFFFCTKWYILVTFACYFRRKTDRVKIVNVRRYRRWWPRTKWIAIEMASFIIYYSYMEMKCWMEIHSVVWLLLFFRF